MNWTKFLWIGGVAVVASIIDLGFLFWQRSNTGHNFSRAGWQAGQLGAGHYNLMKMGKSFHSKGNFQPHGSFHNKGGYHK